MLADPDIQTCETQDLQDGSSVLRMKEVCDVCEDDSLAYAKVIADGKQNKDGSTGTDFKLSDGTTILLSDFVLPAYWNQNAPAGSKFDFMGHISSPLQILPGGYIGVRSIPASSQWSQVTAMVTMEDSQRTGARPVMTLGGKAIKRFSRRARRAIPDGTWKRSAPRHS